MAAPNYRGAAARGNAAGGGPGNRNNTHLGNGARGGGVAGGGNRGGGPPQGSRWGNGPPANSSSAGGNRNGPAGRQNHNAGSNYRQAGHHQQQQHQPHQPPHHQQPQQVLSSAVHNHTSAFPSLGGVANLDEGQKHNRSRMLFLLVTLVGNPVTVTVRGGGKYFGILSSANTDSGDLAVTVASAQEVLVKSADGNKIELGPLKKMLIINGKDLESIEASEVRVGDQEKEMKEAREKEAFRTDTEISRSFDPLGNGRTLQKWSDDPDLAVLDSDVPEWAADSAGGLNGDVRGSAKGWDQFAANEARFGIKSDYEETLYTTTLDRSGKDFKEKERQADRIAREIMGQATNNPHLAEERGQADDSGVNEEDKYGAVVRGPNAYVPPALRKAAGPGGKGNGTASNANGTAAAGSGSAAPADKTATGGGAAVPAPATTNATPGKAQQMPKPPTVSVKVPSPSLSPQEAAKAGTVPSESAKKNPDAANPLMGDFRQFVSSERERLEKKKAALAKKEKDTRLADLKTWASTFKLKTPMPDDVAGVAQKEAAATEKPRDATLQKSLSPTAAHLSAGAGLQAAKAALTPSGGADTAKLASTKASAVGTSSLAPSPSGGAGSGVSSQGGSNTKLAETKAMLANMTIPKIPPYNPDRAKARQAAAAAATTASTAGGAASSSTKPTQGIASNAKRPDQNAAGGVDPEPTTGLTASTSAFRLSARASAFKPFNPNATAFTPGASTSAVKKLDSATASPAISTATAATSASAVAPAPAPAVNKFFGNRVLKKPTTSVSLHVREDFNPFKVSKVPDAKSVGPMWAFSGKPYRQHFVLAGPQGQFEDGTGVMYMQPGPGVGMPMHATPQPSHAMPHHPHGGQGQAQPPHVPVSGPPGGPAAPGQQQPFGMVYQPYGPYRFQHQPQPQPQGPPQPQQHGLVQPMQMPPNGQGGPVPYGGMPPQFMGQMPFSPPLPPHAASQALYSPQMANMPPPGQQFMPGGPGGAGAPHAVGMPGPQGGQGHPVRPPPPHMQQQKGGHPSQMYYAQPQPGPMGGMPYPPQFAMQPGPQPGRPVGPPMSGSAGPASEASSTVGLPTGHGSNEPPSH